MTDAPIAHIPRGAYALLMAAATVVALGCIWALVKARGGTSSHLQTAMIAFGTGSLLTFLPALLRLDREHWGLAVLGAGVGRGVLALALAYFMGLSPAGEPARAVLMGVAAATGLVLLVEVVACVIILSRIERQRDAARSSLPSSSALSH